MQHPRCRGPPRLTAFDRRRARWSDAPERACAIQRGPVTLLLVATLLGPVVMGAAAMPGIALVNLGLLLLLGFVELIDLIDVNNRGVQLTVRLGGILSVLLGVAIQVL